MVKELAMYLHYDLIPKHLPAKMLGEDYTLPAC